MLVSDLGVDDCASWVEALGTVGALAVGVLVVYLQQRHSRAAEAQREADRIRAIAYLGAAMADATRDSFEGLRWARSQEDRHVRERTERGLANSRKAMWETVYEEIRALDLKDAPTPDIARCILEIKGRALVAKIAFLTYADLTPQQIAKGQTTPKYEEWVLERGDGVEWSITALLESVDRLQKLADFSEKYFLAPRRAPSRRDNKRQ